MIYNPNPVDAVLVRKVNRFLCLVKTGGRVHEASIPNSGRLTEFMTSGRRVLVERTVNPKRKTSYTLRAVRYNGRWVCVDSSVPNRLAASLAISGDFPLFDGYTSVRREYTIGRHRFDLLLEGAGLAPMIVEVKSVTLAEGGMAKFPDAPTERGRRHVETLARLTAEGYKSAVMLIAGRSDVSRFEPNWRTDPAFGESLARAARAGVEVVALRCRVGLRSISVIGSIPVSLDQPPL